MNPCGVSRVLIVAVIAGMVASLVSGNDLVGWIAALAVTGAMLGYQRFRGTAAACPIEPARIPARPPTETDAR